MPLVVVLDDHVGVEAEGLGDLLEQLADAIDWPQPLIGASPSASSSGAAERRRAGRLALRARCRRGAPRGAGLPPLRAGAARWPASPSSAT